MIDLCVWSNGAPGITRSVFFAFEAEKKAPGSRFQNKYKRRTDNGEGKPKRII